MSDMTNELATMYVPIALDKDALTRMLGELREQIRVTVAQAVRDGINDAYKREQTVEPVRFDTFPDPAAFEAKLKNEQTQHPL